MRIVLYERQYDYYDYQCDSEQDVIQEVPDTIGTHAVLSDDGFATITLKEVISWRLLNNGTIEAMIANEAEMVNTPVLPGDECLYAADKNKDFHYFFQHNIANKLKSKDPEALEAISLLKDG